ncbi:MAG: MFS transporter [Anaerolineae bacterium]
MKDSPINAPVGRMGLRGLPRNVWVVTAASFLTDVSSEMLVHLIPLFLANVLGVRLSLIGLIEGVAETTASLLKLLSGWLSDRLGDRKWLTVLGYSLSTLAKPFLYIANSWGAVLAVRFTDRVGKGIRTAPRDALVADSIDESRRGLAFGLHRAGDTAGALLGLLIALAVVRVMQGHELTLERTTFRTIVLLSILPAALAVLALVLGARNVPVTSQRQRPQLSLRGFDSRFKRFLAVVVLFTLGNSSDAFLVLRAQSLGLSLTAVLGVLALFNLIYALLSTPAGALSDRVGRRRLIIGGWLVYALIYLGFGLARASWQIWLLFALYGVYYALAEGAAKALVADVVPASQRGAAYGVYNAAIGLAALPASLLAGILWQGIGGWSGFGPSAPFIFGAMLALLAAMLLGLGNGKR